MGGDYRINTPLRATAKPDKAGVLAGDLIVSGRGDPGWDFRGKKAHFQAIFYQFIEVLRHAGVKRITGDIVADATWLRQPPQGASWTADDMDFDFGAEISAITLADNYVDLRITPAAKVGEPCAIDVLPPDSGLLIDNRTTTAATGSAREIRVLGLRGDAERVVHVFGTLPVGGKVELTEAPVWHPESWFARALREALTKAGIEVDGNTRGVRWPDAAPAGEVMLGEVKSAPLRDLVAGFMLPSQNLETDLIFGHLGELRRTAATPAWVRSDELALTALDDFLTKQGVPAGSVLFDEGSGLSRNNLATAGATVQLLAAMSRHREAAAFYASLPVAGVSGSIDKRMRGTPAESNVRAKTGTLRYASSLSGYVTTAAGEKLAFSAMLNRHPVPPGAKAGDPLDELAVILARHDRR